MSATKHAPCPLHHTTRVPKGTRLRPVPRLPHRLAEGLPTDFRLGRWHLRWGRGGAGWTGGRKMQSQSWAAGRLVLKQPRGSRNEAVPRGPPALARPFHVLCPSVSTVCPFCPCTPPPGLAHSRKARSTRLLIFQYLLSLQTRMLMGSLASEGDFEGKQARA